MSLYLQFDLVLDGSKEHLRQFEDDIRFHLRDDLIRLPDLVEDRAGAGIARVPQAFELFNTVIAPRPPSLLRRLTIEEAIPGGKGRTQKLTFVCDQLPIHDLEDVSATWPEVAFRCIVSLRDGQFDEGTFQASAVCIDGSWQEFVRIP